MLNATSLPEMLHSMNSLANLAGSCTEMTVFERQRARFKWQQEQLQLQLQQSQWQRSDFGAFCGGNLETSVEGCLMVGLGGEAVFGGTVNHPVKPDPGLENGWPEAGSFGVPGLGGDCGVFGGGSGNGTELNFVIPRTLSCLPAVAAATVAEERGKELAVASEKITQVGRESIKKRKLDKFHDTKDEDVNCRDKKIKGCPEEVESKITEQSNNKNNKKNETPAATSKDNSKVSEVQKPDYIHVRARRGQATDSHSLAERVRREKISERMKFLQDLVPGCNKITGKAGMLDEIINYVQSLQRQVEFLSMKLAAVNPGLDLDLDSIFAKEMIPACTASFPAIPDLPSEITNLAYLQFNPTQQVASCSSLEMGMNSDLGLRRTTSAPVSIPNTFIGSSGLTQIVQRPATWDVGLQDLYNMEFHQGRTIAFPSQQFAGAVEGNNVKMEM